MWRQACWYKFSRDLFSFLCEPSLWSWSSLWSPNNGGMEGVSVCWTYPELVISVLSILPSAVLNAEILSWRSIKTSLFAYPSCLFFPFSVLALVTSTVSWTQLFIQKAILYLTIISNWFVSQRFKNIYICSIIMLDIKVWTFFPNN